MNLQPFLNALEEMKAERDHHRRCEAASRAAANPIREAKNADSAEVADHCVALLEQALRECEEQESPPA